MEGIDGLLKDLEKIKNKYPKEVDKFLTRQGNKLLKITKIRTPVDTGTLRNAWMMKKEKNKVTVFNIADYVLPVEYGTIHKAGRFMLTKSVKDIEDEFESDLKKTFKEVFND